MKPKYAHEEEAKKILQENERKFKEAQEKLNENAKKILDAVMGSYYLLGHVLSTT